MRLLILVFACLARTIDARRVQTKSLSLLDDSRGKNLPHKARVETLPVLHSLSELKQSQLTSRVLASLLMGFDSAASFQASGPGAHVHSVGGLPGIRSLRNSVMDIESAMFDSSESHRAWLAEQDGLPQGFAVGTTRLDFRPEEAPEMSAVMCLTLIRADEPTPSFAAVTTSSKFPGAPVKVVRRRLEEPLTQAIVINNKVSNVCPSGDGEADAECICAAAASVLSIADSKLVLPCSTGVIGWKLPVAAMEAAMPDAAATLQTTDMLPAATAIMTTDRYPKLRSRTLNSGARIVGIAKGAGMIEPNMATMLSYVLTDLTVPRDTLREALRDAADASFNCISVDSDESTSDMLICLSSGKQEASAEDIQEFQGALRDVCQELARDVVRNGEGTQHVIQVCITNANKLNRQEMRDLGRAVVNSPLFKCAVAGNDPNVGRLVGAIGKCAGRLNLDVDPEKVTLKLGGTTIYEKGSFSLDGDMERRLSSILRDAMMPPEVSYPVHERIVDIEVDLGHGGGKDAGIMVWGSDLTKEYVSINADYRS